MEKLRSTKKLLQQDRLIMQLSVKELKADEAIEVKSMRSSAITASARLLRDIAQMDQYENMKRNVEL